MCPCAFLSAVLTTVEMVSHKGMKKKPQDVPSECHHASIYDSRRGSGGLASEEKVIFVLKLLGPILQFISTDSAKRISKELKQATGEPPLIH